MKQNLFKGHHPLEKGKYAEIRKFINSWLMDSAVYCNNCGMPYFSSEICCDNPQIGKNLDHCWAVIINNKARRTIRENEFASNPQKTMRLGLSMPEKLIRDLEAFCQKTMGEKLFVDNKDLHRFMRAFPQFVICGKI